MLLQKSIRFFFAALLLLTVEAALAQSSRDRDKGEDKKKDEEPSSFASHLWYGGSFALNFYGYNGGNVFTIGLSPMVGYKIIEQISIGPRVSFTFSSLKYPGFKALGLFNTQIGSFIRIRAFKGFFVQGEIAHEWSDQEDYFAPPNPDRTIPKYTIQRLNQYAGAGYNFGNGEGGAGSEIGIYYNFAVASDLNTYQNPWEYRLGFTWKF